MFGGLLKIIVWNVRRESVEELLRHSGGKWCGRSDQHVEKPLLTSCSDSTTSLSLGFVPVDVHGRATMLNFFASRILRCLFHFCFPLMISFA